MINKLKNYFSKDYQLVNSNLYYFRLSLIVGLSLTFFVFIFDPYDNYLAPKRIDIPMKIIQLGYGVNTSLVIYFFYWIIFHKKGLLKGKIKWKTYHHWVLLIIIMVVAGFLGTVYHRLVMVIGKVETSYYVLITIPRSMLIGLTLFIISILLDELYANRQYRTRNFKSVNVHNNGIVKNTIVIKSPMTNQSIELSPKDILYLKAAGNYVEIYLKEKKHPELIRASLHYVAEKLSSFSFLKKCHRQYHVNVNEVASFKANSQKTTLLLKNYTHKIPVSKRHNHKILMVIKQ